MKLQRLGMGISEMSALKHENVLILQVNVQNISLSIAAAPFSLLRLKQTVLIGESLRSSASALRASLWPMNQSN